jgi:hypothetical protein
MRSASAPYRHSIRAAWLSAAALWLYGVVVVWGWASNGGPIVAHGPVDVLVRAAAAIAIGAGLISRVGLAPFAASFFATVLGLSGLVGIGGQLYQRYVPDSAGMYILLNPVAFTVTIVSTSLLLAVLVINAPWWKKARR